MNKKRDSLLTTPYGEINEDFLQSGEFDVQEFEDKPEKHSIRVNDKGVAENK